MDREHRPQKQEEKERRVLVVTSVDTERDAILRGMGEMGDKNQVEVHTAGVGVARATAATALALSAASYDLVVSAGIAGGFPGQAEVGSLVLASEIVAADLGAETAEGFCRLDELGLGPVCIHMDASLVKRLESSLRLRGLDVKTGPILTVSTVTGSKETADELAVRIPGAAAEGMEGFGVATAAQLKGIPVLEMRAVSNFVGPRNRSAWRIDKALEVLEKASGGLMEVII
ncbi:futalosine hydrolase [Thermoactinomyces mirandus]|uniref:Futalosine hydrolase n=1 Tax=Thermoactinomyces mirandus TaxID=2756294 RepID=A0A7W2AR28_9BACL|nr:futalosine hydrolase [Thermoactinomyces mirandus]MBA4602138.1 futalosine hydrolase [Thermoactinomyces mirandus]